VLAAVFAVAVWMRVRTWESNPVDPERGTIDSSQTSAAGGFRGGHASENNAGGEQTSTIVDATRASGSASSRERRYEELLRTDPPAPPAPRREPSFLDRVMAPIAGVLGIGSKPDPNAAQPAAPSTAAPHVEDGPSQAEAPSTSPSGDETTTEPGEPDDETDIVAPQLLTADFTPREVRDGEETVFAAMVQDNLSGVRTVSGVITSPSGSTQGFSCTREGESSRFTSRIRIPKDAPEGTWVVKYMTLADNASNSIHLNQGQGVLPPSASFQVVSAGSDASGPQLEAIWFERNAMRAGERNTVFVQARDDKAGVSLVSGVLVSPSKSARIGFGCRLGAANTWECPVTPPSCLDCGLWRLEQIQLQDKAQNLTTFRQDHQAVTGVSVDIAGDLCDSSPPVIASLTLDPVLVTNAQASIITVSAVVVDDLCGTASLSGQAIPPGGIGGQRRYISFQPQPDGRSFVGKLEIPQFAAKGQWHISWIQTLDKGHNLKAYPATDPALAKATFVVE
jgi:hypothetical protein